MRNFRFVNLIALASVALGDPRAGQSDASVVAPPPIQTLTAESSSRSQLNYAYIKQAWAVAGRAWLAKYSGLGWDETAHRWHVTNPWASESNAAQNAYNLEYVLRPAVNMGSVCHDKALLEGLAQFELAFSAQFTTLGALRRYGGPSADHTLLNNQGADSSRTLLWVQKGPGRDMVRECTLCNSQMLHPVARLLRVLSSLSPTDRSPLMNQFARLYGPLLVKDHLMRLLYEADFDPSRGPDVPHKLVDNWKSLASRRTLPGPRYRYAMSDVQLWLLGTAAEVLGAHKDAPELVPLSAVELQNLTAAVAAGTAALQTERHLATDGAPDGTTRERASYFDGDYDDHPDFAFSGNVEPELPTKERAHPHRGTSWDVSHFYRVPVVMRSLYDNRQATGAAFPTPRDLLVLSHQLVFVVFNRDWERPLFKNFFDGNDGWYRVGYGGSGTGYPPSLMCSQAPGSKRPCLMPGAVMGWGLLAEFDPELAHLEDSLVALAASKSEQARTFRDRYYFWNNQHFALTDDQAKPAYPLLLFIILGGNVGRQTACEQLH